MNPNPDERALTCLLEGKLTMQGEFIWGSNYTFLIQVEHTLGEYQAVYKPNKGVRPLWDFPSQTLARREVAAYLVDLALGWNQVPPTVFRPDGPLGPGSLQLFIEHDPEYHYFNFSPQDRQRLRPVALFDLLINNADRKGSHILFDPNRKIWLIDHGICFHVQEKLRTVVWDYSGEGIPEELCRDLSQLRQKIASQQIDPNSPSTQAGFSRLNHYLSPTEIAALLQRADRLVAAGRFPDPDPGRRHYPWPAI